MPERLFLEGDGFTSRQKNKAELHYCTELSKRRTNTATSQLAHRETH